MQLERIEGALTQGVGHFGSPSYEANEISHVKIIDFETHGKAWWKLSDAVIRAIREGDRTEPTCDSPLQRSAMRAAESCQAISKLWIPVRVLSPT